MENALLLFVRNPEKGKVKTRLARDLGDDQALEIYLRLMAHSRQCALGVEADRFLFYSDFVDRDDDFSNENFRKYVQCAGDLGARMDYAFSLPFKIGGYRKVVIIGSDCPGLSPELINQAFDALDEHDVVLGPSLDGGYYLLGMKRWQRNLFEGKAWSTDSVLSDTRKQIEQSGGRLALLPELRDVDTAADWEAEGRP